MIKQGFKDELRNKMVNPQSILLSSARPMKSNTISGKKQISEEATKIAEVFTDSLSYSRLAVCNCVVGEPSNATIFALCLLTKQKRPT